MNKKWFFLAANLVVSNACLCNEIAIDTTSNPDPACVASLIQGQIEAKQELGRLKAAGQSFTTYTSESGVKNIIPVSAFENMANSSREAIEHRCIRSKQNVPEIK